MDIKKNGHRHEKGEWFYPDLADNLEKPETERAAICFTRITGRELQKINGKLEARIKPSKNALRSTLRLEKQKREDVIVEHAVGFKNWNLTGDDGSKEPIEDMAALIAIIVEHWPNAQEATGFVDQCYAFVVGESTLEEELRGE